MSLEEEVNNRESESFIKKAGKLAWKIGMAAATTALSMAALPAIGASASLGIWVGGAFAGGGMLANLAKGKSLYDSLDAGLTTYSAVNAVIYPMAWLGDATFPLIANDTLTGWIGRGLYASTAYNAAFVGSYKAAGHLVDNYMNPKGITKSVGDGFFDLWKNVGLVFSPAYFAAANGISAIKFGSLAVPTFAAWALPSGFILDYFLGKDKPKPHGYGVPAYAGAH